ncbi:MAG: enolase C-terminal domain-like protein [Acidobacteriota bacterium]
MFGFRSARGTDIRITEITFSYENYLYRTPYKFGGKVSDRATILNVDCLVETLDGRRANGFGSMPLGNVWSFPTTVMDYDTTLGAMKVLAQRIHKITAGFKGSGHPIDINVELEPEYLKAAAEVSEELKLAHPIPKLCTQVTASAFDAALHDGFGKVHGLSCYLTYGSDFMAHDLSDYLGPEFKGEYIEQYISKSPKPEVAVFHSVGAGDPITDSDVQERLDDGLPQTLPEWIGYNGLTHFKIKLNGSDLEQDIERVLRIDATVNETVPAGTPCEYLVDFNENCPNVQYVLDFLRRVREGSPEGFQRIQYIEQPTSRDLKADRNNVMHEAAKLRPVIIDESLTDEETLLLAREMGYNGVALKACKGQSQAMLMTAASRKHQMFLTVQDLTCPGASLIHSAGIAAHVPEVRAIEANSRQYMPAANESWTSRFPGIFVIKDGRLKTAALTGPGLSAVS